jgi:hypothetical protein
MKHELNLTIFLKSHTNSFYMIYYVDVIKVHNSYLKYFSLWWILNEVKWKVPSDCVQFYIRGVINFVAIDLYL